MSREYTAATGLIRVRPVKCIRDPRDPPHLRRRARPPPRRRRPRARLRHRRAGHGQGRPRRRRRRGRGSDRAHHRRLPAAGPDPERHPHSRRVRTRRQRRVASSGPSSTRTRRRPRWPRPAATSPSVPGDTAIPTTTRVLMVASGKGGVGKSSVTVNLAAALAARGLRRRADRRRHLGLLRAPHARASRAASRATRRPVASSPSPCRSADGRIDVVSMGLLVDAEETALMWRGLMLQRAVQHFLEDVELERRPRLPAHRHATWHRRRADGPGQAPAPRRDDRRHHAVAQRPEGRGAGRQHGPAQLPPGRRRRREHERVRRTGRHAARRSSAVAAATTSRSRPAWTCSRASRSRPRSPRAATQADPWPGARVRPPTRSAPSPSRSSTEIAPPIDMAGCSVRLLDAATAALDAHDRAGAKLPG